MSIITNTELQRKFDSATENSSNRKMSIEFEIRAIEDFVDNIPFISFRGKSQSTRINKSPKIFNFDNVFFDRRIFNEAFYEYLNNGKVISIIQEQNDNNKSFTIKQNSVEQSIEFFKYYKWLNDLLSTPQKVTTKNSLSHKQKLLALHYLGLNTSKYENTKIAKVLAEVLELNEANTRIFLSYLSAGKNEVRTKANLEKVSQLFEKQGVSEISGIIKKDIEKL